RTCSGTATTCWSWSSAVRRLTATLSLTLPGWSTTASATSRSRRWTMTKVVKVRCTTRLETWTVPVDCEERVEFLHREPWDELHVVHQETKTLLAVYSRAQVLGMMSRPGKLVKKSQSGRKVQILKVS